MSKVILVANPGSASRKYALYDGEKLLLSLHFEEEDGQVVVGINEEKKQPVAISDVAFAASVLPDILASRSITITDQALDTVAIRIVAPSPFFQQHRLLDDTALHQLEKLKSTAPLHINACMQEIAMMQRFLPHTRLVGISDSAFHSTMPDYARYYGIPKQDAEKLNIQRYGFHGLSVESVVNKLHSHKSIPDKMIVCHLGSGVSVTALSHGKSIDTTMGYSPLEGTLMATRSGSIDPTAVHALQIGLGLSSAKLQQYLNYSSGLKGISGSTDDIRQLLIQEKAGQKNATLALQMYMYRIQQAIGQMAASLGGVDAIVFTGTIGVRSQIIRQRICNKLHFLGAELDNRLNVMLDPKPVHKISHTGCPTTLYVIPTDEMGEIARHTQKLLSSSSHT